MGLSKTVEFVVSVARGLHHQLEGPGKRVEITELALSD
jgi:hypothetical protein